MGGENVGVPRKNFGHSGDGFGVQSRAQDSAVFVERMDDLRHGLRYGRGGRAAQLLLPTQRGLFLLDAGTTTGSDSTYEDYVLKSFTSCLHSSCDEDYANHSMLF